METALNWVRSSSRGVKISFLQGFFESAGELDPASQCMIAPVLPMFVEDIVRIFRELNIRVAVVYDEPVTMAVSIHDAMRIPLLNPSIKNGKYYEMRSSAMVHE